MAGTDILVRTKCLDCGVVDYKVIKTDMLVYCAECRSGYVIWPYEPKLIPLEAD